MFRSAFKRSRIALTNMLLVFALLPIAAIAQEDPTPESNPYGYYYKGEYIALDPSRDLIAMSERGAEFS